MRWKTAILPGLAIVLSAATPGGVGASPVNLVQNGGFETMVSGGVINRQLANGISSTSTALDKWTVGAGTVASLNYLVGPNWTTTTIPGHSPHTGAWGQYNQFNVWTKLSGGASNGFTDSPTGGNYIVAYGENDYHATISQLISGLNVGQNYDVSFWWATGQERGSNGQTTNKGWDVSFGGATQQTARNTDASRGFTNWVRTTMTFTATSGSQLLSFLAQGDPNGQPISPLVFLDGVSVTASVPEPSTIVMMGLGVAGLGLFRLRQRRTS